MAITSAEAKAYGESLHVLAREENISKEIMTELKELAKLFDSCPDYVKILDSPQISHDELIRILDEDFSDKLNKYVLNFLKLLSEKRMISRFKDCVSEYERLYNEDNHITTVYVTTASPLSDTLYDKLKLSMEKKTGGPVIIKTKIDEDCIGGMVIKTDDMCMDLSVRRELKDIYNTIVK